MLNRYQREKFVQEHVRFTALKKGTQANFWDIGKVSIDNKAYILSVYCDEFERDDYAICIGNETFLSNTYRWIRTNILGTEIPELQFLLDITDYMLDTGMIIKPELT